MDKQYPTTGRVGRFVKIVQRDAVPDAAETILKDAQRYDAMDPAEKSAWWKGAAERMEARLGREAATKIMHQCGAKCCGKGQRATAVRLYQEAGNLEAFLKKIENHDVQEGDLAYTLLDDHTILGEHRRCFCRQVGGGKIPFASLTYCQCSVEFNRQFFTAALGREAQVELLQSIICGAEKCKFKITF